MSTPRVLPCLLAVALTPTVFAQPAYCPRLDWLDRIGTEEDDAIVAVASSPLRPGLVLVGTTVSEEFPTTLGTFAPLPFGVEDVVVGELHVFEPRFAWATYLGGSDSERATDVAINAAGRIAVVGVTRSRDFPTTVASFDPSYNSDEETSGDAFLSIFDPDGRLLYSTYLGGRDVDVATTVAWDSSGRVLIGGTTRSASFPTTAGAYEETTAFGSRDAFALIIDPAGKHADDLVYSTILRGSDAADDEVVSQIATDHEGFLLVTGQTDAVDFPRTRDAFDIVAGGELDGFLVRIEPAGNGAADLCYGTYLGGRKNDRVHDFVVGTDQVLTIVGDTESRDFPWRDLRSHPPPGTDGFVIRFHPGGRGPQDLHYVEIIEGDENETLTALAFAPDRSRDPIIVGSASRSAALPSDARTAPDDEDDHAAVQQSTGAQRVTEGRGIIGRLVLSPNSRLDCFAPVQLDAVSGFVDLATKIDGTLFVVGATSVAPEDATSIEPGDGLVARYFISVPGCVGDFNDDRNVDRADLVLMLEQQGPCAACVFDLDRDGIVGLRDASLLTTVWGACR
ncbi:MAG: hypothetical protein KJO43_01345 [Phycisphaerae bacterium]|nr:hypothetical protein [Phycisphaerae bacterium]